MTKIIAIEDIDKLSETRTFPLYVLVAGGMAVGKTYIVTEKINSIKIFDIDEVMAEMEFTDYNHEQFEKAMNVMIPMIESHMNKKKSMIAMGTASDVIIAVDRLFAAKQNGYETILLYIEAPIDQSLVQNKDRMSRGERGVSKDNEFKIKKTNKGAANTVDLLKESNLVDFFVHYDNTRDGDLNE